MIDAFIAIGTALIALIILPLIRLVAGPTIPDRMVALDVINTFVISALLIFGLAFETIIYVDVAIVYTILSYVATLFIAKYVEGEL